VVQTCHFEKFLQLIFARLSLALEVTFGSYYALLTGVTSFLVIATIAGYYVDAMGSLLLPFFLPLARFLVPLMVALLGVAPLPLDTAPTLASVKAAPTASSPEVCQVTVSSSSLVVFDHL
jgi:hypothetical protein